MALYTQKGSLPYTILWSVLLGTADNVKITCSEHQSWHQLARSEEDKVIFTVCAESKKCDKYNSDLLARDTHLKPQNQSYLNSWMVIVVVFVCAFLCVCVKEFLCDKYFRVVGCWCDSVTVTTLISICLLMSNVYWFHCVNVTLFISLCLCHCVYVTMLMKIYLVEQHLNCKRWLITDAS